MTRGLDIEKWGFYIYMTPQSISQLYRITFIFYFIQDAESGQMYGLEKFWAFMKYYKHSSGLHVDKKLKALMEPFKTIEDFKVYYSVSKIVSISKIRICLISVGFLRFLCNM